jgi:dTDP-4-amino-4,6-dideoxy-D-galactose acyltransferase
VPAEPADCVFLDWDSRFWGRRIGRLRNRRLTNDIVRQVITWTVENSIDCLYFLADANDDETTALAENNCFHQTDVRITLERSVPTLNHAPLQQIRNATDGDLPILCELAANSHRDGRFYFDSNFERADCDRFYATWLENSFRESPKAVLVAEVVAEPVGYITCKIHDRESQIGIMAVANHVRGEGFGKMLVNGFLDWSFREQAQSAMVVTQGRNVAAQRLYQSCGFRTRSFEHWYHRWSLVAVPQKPGASMPR